MMKQWLFILFCIGSITLHSVEPRDQDLQCILDKTFLSSDQLLSMLALEAAQASEKSIDSAKAVETFKKQFFEEKAQGKFREVYSIFTNAEMREIRKIHESPAYQKYMQETGKTFPKSLEILRGMFREIVHQDGVAKDMEKLAPSFLEITQANFQEEVNQSSKPLIVDVYSSACPPCRLMEPILEELSQEFEEIRFVKINCDTEAELARKYGVTQLPTFLFIKPGQEEPVGKAVGFTAKETFEEKIAEFLWVKTDKTRS